MSEMKKRRCRHCKGEGYKMVPEKPKVTVEALGRYGPASEYLQIISYSGSVNEAYMLIFTHDFAVEEHAAPK